MAFQPAYRPQGRSVWLGKELAQSDDWIYRFSPRALDEIDQCVRRLGERDAYLESVSREEFPLADIAGDLAAAKAELGTGRGFLVMRGLDRERYSQNQLGLIFRGIAAHFGVPQTQSALGDRLGDVRDISDEIPERRNRRGYQSGGYQTAHTDPNGEADIVGMLSLQAARSGGESLIASAHAVHNMLLDWCPELLALFYEGFLLRRPDSDAAMMGKPPLIGKIPSFVYQDGWLNCDYQNGYMRRAEENGDCTLSPPQHAAIAAFNAFSNHPNVMLKMLLAPGDLQFFNNRVVLHGRAAYEDHADKDRRRHLYRLWLKVPEWPRMPAQQGTLWAEDMAQWDAHAARRRARISA